MSEKSEREKALDAVEALTLGRMKCCGVVENNRTSSTILLEQLEILGRIDMLRRHEPQDGRE